jgi:hypothetical protein
LKNVVDKIAKVKVVVHHASATAVAVAQTSEIVTIADHAALAQIVETVPHATVMIAAHVNSMIADHAAHAQNAATVPHATVMIAAHVNSMIADHAALAQNAATAHLAIVMPVAHVAQVATVAVLALAVQDHVNAAPSDLHVALRESMQSC